MTGEELRHVQNTSALSTVQINSGLTAAGLKEIARLPHLRSLHLQDPPVSPSAFQELENCQDLSTLMIAAETLPDELFPILARLPVTRLELWNRGAPLPAPSAFEHIARAPYLQILDLRMNGLTDSHLDRLTGLRWLQAVYIQHAVVTEAALQRFRNRHPLCEVHVRNSQ